MFVQMSKEKEEAIRKAGDIEIVPVTHRFDTTISEQTIIFRNKEEIDGRTIGYVTKLFTCSLLVASDSYMLLEIDTIKSEKYTFDEASLYFFLRLVVERAHKWAKRALKRKLIIRSRLPHITEILADHDFTIRQADLLCLDASDVGYRGRKLLF